MKIVILEAATVSKNDISFDEIYKLGEVTEYPLTPVDKIVEYVSDAQAVLCNKTPFTAQTLKGCPNLKYIGLCATGYNNIDVEAAAKMGITVCNVPAYSNAAVAQQVFSFILRYANRTSAYNRFVHEGGWIKSETFSAFEYPITELAGKTLGIVGYGRIGHAVAKIAQAFDMKVVVNTRTAKQDGSVKFVGLNELLSTSDFISLHCPLTTETTEIINIDALKLCKPTAILINTSRGAVINENDLAYALNNDIIAGAGLDVLCEEPMEENNVLLNAKNCIITPHIAWAPLDTRKRLIRIVAENLAAFQNDRPINTVS